MLAASCAEVVVAPRWEFTEALAPCEVLAEVLDSAGMSFAHETLESPSASLPVHVEADSSPAVSKCAPCEKFGEVSPRPVPSAGGDSTL